MSATIKAFKEAVGMALPVHLRKRFVQLPVSLWVLTFALAAPAANAHQRHSIVGGGLKSYSFARSEAAAAIPGPELHAPGEQESTAPRPTQLTLEQEGPKQLRVTYEDGNLTIIAVNSELSEVLSAVRAQTGADIEIPPGATGQRIWAELGPGSARIVLATLLDSTKLDYVIRASETDPRSIRSILLILREKTATAVVPGVPGTAMGQPTRGAIRRMPQSIPGAAESSDQENSSSTESSASPEGAQADQSPPSPDQQRIQLNLQASPAAFESNSNVSAGRSTDQMIQNLRQMYEQRRQMQQQNQKPPAPSPTPN